MLKLAKVKVKLQISKDIPTLNVILKTKHMPINILKRKIDKTPAYYLSARTIIIAITRSLLR